MRVIILVRERTFHKDFKLISVTH